MEKCTICCLVEANRETMPTAKIEKLGLSKHTLWIVIMVSSGRYLQSANTKQISIERNNKTKHNKTLQHKNTVINRLNHPVWPQTTFN